MFANLLREHFFFNSTIKVVVSYGFHGFENSFFDVFLWVLL